MNANMMLKKMMWFLHLPCSPTVQSAADWKDVRNWNGSVSLEIYQEPNRKHRKPIYSTQEPYNRNQPKQGPISVHLSLYLSVCVPCQECNKWPEAFSGLQTFFSDHTISLKPSSQLQNANSEQSSCKFSSFSTSIIHQKFEISQEVIHHPLSAFCPFWKEIEKAKIHSLFWDLCLNHVYKTTLHMYSLWRHLYPKNQSTVDRQTQVQALFVNYWGKMWKKMAWRKRGRYQSSENFRETYSSTGDHREEGENSIRLSWHLRCLSWYKKRWRRKKMCERGRKY